MLERDSILDENNIELITDMGVKSVFVQKEEVSGDFAIIYNTSTRIHPTPSWKPFSTSTASSRCRCAG